MSRRSQLLWVMVPSLVVALSACRGNPTPAATSTSSAAPTLAGSTTASPTSAATSAPVSSSASSAAPSAEAAPAILDDATKAKLQQSFEKSFGTAFANGVQTPGAVAYVAIGDQQWISTLGVTTSTPSNPWTRMTVDASAAFPNRSSGRQCSSSSRTAR